MIKEFLQWTGLVFWSFAVLIAVYMTAGLLWQWWQRNRLRTWLGQAIDYYGAMRFVWKQNAVNFTGEINWYQTYAMHYRLVNGLDKPLFAQDMIILLELMMDSEEYKTKHKEKVEAYFAPEIERVEKEGKNV